MKGKRHYAKNILQRKWRVAGLKLQNKSWHLNVLRSHPMSRCLAFASMLRMCISARNVTGDLMNAASPPSFVTMYVRLVLSALCSQHQGVGIGWDPQGSPGVPSGWGRTFGVKPFLRRNWGEGAKILKAWYVRVCVYSSDYMPIHLLKTTYKIVQGMIPFCRLTNSYFGIKMLTYP